MSVVLDTTVLIDLLRGYRPAIDYAADLPAPPACSEISRVEVLRGLRSDERRDAESLFSDVVWVPVDEAIARLAGELGRRFRRSHQALATADLIIGATAQELRLAIATTKVRDFPMFSGLRPPYRPSSDSGRRSCWGTWRGSGGARGPRRGVDWTGRRKERVVLAYTIGPFELLVVLAIILLLFGATKLPALARSLGRSTKEFKQGMREGGVGDDEPDTPERAAEPRSRIPPD